MSDTTPYFPVASVPAQYLSTTSQPARSGNIASQSTQSASGVQSNESSKPLYQEYTERSARVNELYQKVQQQLSKYNAELAHHHELNAKYNKEVSKFNEVMQKYNQQYGYRESLDTIAERVANLRG